MGWFGLFSLAVMGIGSIVDAAKISDYDEKARARAAIWAKTGENRLGIYRDYKGAERDLVTGERVNIKYIHNEPVVYGENGQFLRNIAVNEARKRVEEEKKKIAEGKSHRTHIPLLGKYGEYIFEGVYCRKQIDIETGKIYYVRRVEVKNKHFRNTTRSIEDDKVTMHFLYNPNTKQLVRPTDKTVLECCLDSLKYEWGRDKNGNEFTPNGFVDFVKKEVIPKVVEDDKHEEWIINRESHDNYSAPSRDDFLNILEEYKQEQREIAELWEKRAELIEYKKQNGIHTYWRNLLPEDYELKYKHEKIVY